MGTSHRQKPVKHWSGGCGPGCASCSLPDGYEIALGNGGTTAFWDAATCGLVARPRAAPDLRGVLVQVRGVHQGRAVPRRPDRDRAAEPGDAPEPAADPDADVVAWAQNETSTGVMVPVIRPPGAGDALVLIDATSGAGGLPVDVAQADAYYFAPQKGFASDGGLWLALLARRRSSGSSRSPERGRGALDPRIPVAEDGARELRKDQTYNTPAIATLFLLADQLDWMLERGGLEAMVARTTESSTHLYGWAEAHEHATPFVVRSRQALARRRHDRLRRRSTPPRSRRRCAQTGSSTSSRTASSAATSCGSRCSPPPTRPTCGR